MIIWWLLIELVWAQERPTVHVQQIDPVMNVEAMGGSGIQTHKLQVVRRPKDPPLLTKPVQQRLLVESKLKEDIQNWDPFKKTMLFVDAKNYSLIRLTQKYKSLNKDKLAKFKSLVMAIENK